MKAFHAFIISLFVIGTPVTAATNEIDLTVIAGAETHAMIEPCDCPQDPGGGLAKRSTLVKSIRKETICFCWMQGILRRRNL